MRNAVSTLDDASLAEAVTCRDADRTAAAFSYGELYRRHARSVLAFLAARAHKSELADLLERVWLKVWEKLTGSVGDFRVWLFQMARTRLIENLRVRGTDPMGDAGMNAPSTASRPGDNLLDWEHLQLLQGCLQRLDELEDGVIRALLGGESSAEICSRLQIDSSTIGEVVQSAAAKLRGCVANATRLHVLDVPVDPQPIVPWLESHLVGLELGELVAELACVHQGAGDSMSSLEDVLGERRSVVLREGLAALESAQMRLLLRNPGLILELQELVLCQGGDHWSELLGTTQSGTDVVDSVWNGLERKVGLKTAVEPRRIGGVPWYRRPWAAVVHLLQERSDG